LNPLDPVNPVAPRDPVNPVAPRDPVNPSPAAIGAKFADTTDSSEFKTDALLTEPKSTLIPPTVTPSPMYNRLVSVV
jgi:hypothetical protein